MGRAPVADFVQAWRTPEHRLGFPILCQACGWHQGLGDIFSHVSLPCWRNRAARTAATQRSYLSFSILLGFCQAPSWHASLCVCTHLLTGDRTQSTQPALGHTAACRRLWNSDPTAAVMPYPDLVWGHQKHQEVQSRKRRWKQDEWNHASKRTRYRDRREHFSDCLLGLRKIDPLSQTDRTGSHIRTETLLDRFKDTV